MAGESGGNDTTRRGLKNNKFILIDWICENSQILPTTKIDTDLCIAKSTTSRVPYIN